MAVMDTAPVAQLFAHAEAIAQIHRQAAETSRQAAERAERDRTASQPASTGQAGDVRQ